MQKPLIRRQSRQETAFTLIEVALGMFVFLMMTLLFAASFPLISGQAQASDNQAQAAMLAQHKIDQLRSAGFSVLGSPGGSSSNNNAITLAGLGIVDTGSISSGFTVPYSASFTTVDNIAATSGPGSGYFPQGSTGILTVQDLKTVNSTLSVTAGTVYKITVTITWPATASVGGTYTATSLIAKNGGQ
jgi:type II secretory pathway pseudopilin PulG